MHILLTILIAYGSIVLGFTVLGIALTFWRTTVILVSLCVVTLVAIIVHEQPKFEAQQQCYYTSLDVAKAHNIEVTNQTLNQMIKICLADRKISD